MTAAGLCFSEARVYLRKFSMRRVRLCIQKHHLILIKFIEPLRILHKEAMAYYLLRRILILLLIKSVRTPEIRNITLRRYTRASEKHNPAAVKSYITTGNMNCKEFFEKNKKFLVQVVFQGKQVTLLHLL